MKSHLLVSFMFISFFSTTSQAGISNPLTWFDWQEPQQLETAIDKRISLTETVELNKFIGEKNRRYVTNVKNLLLDGKLMVSEDYYPEESGDDFYCALNLYSTDLNIPPVNTNEIDIFIVDTIGAQGYNWKNGKFSWITANLSDADETITGDITCSRINSSEKIEYVPFIKMIRPVIKLQ